MEGMPYFRFVHFEEDEAAAREYPRQSLTWVRDLGGYRRTGTETGDQRQLVLPVGDD